LLAGSPRSPRIVNVVLAGTENTFPLAVLVITRLPLIVRLLTFMVKVFPPPVKLRETLPLKVLPGVTNNELQVLSPDIALQFIELFIV
jgi:hypothetical protein